MSIALVVTEGFGNATLLGSIKDVTLEGYSIDISRYALSIGGIIVEAFLDACPEAEPLLDATASTGRFLTGHPDVEPSP